MKLGRKFPLALLFSTALLPSVAVVRSALADDEDDAPATAQTMTSEQLSKKRRDVLRAIPNDEAVLINVTGRDMPASPDILNLGRRSTKALARCVSDNVDDGIRAKCAEMLGRIGDRGGLTALQGALEAWDSQLRGSAIWALRKIPDASNVAPLEKILGREDESTENRAAALEALGAQGNTRAIKTLRAMFRNPPDSEPGLAYAAFRGIWKSRHLMDRGTLVGDVSHALSSGQAELILAATFAASELRAGELSAPLIKLMKNPDARIRNRAVYALGKIGDKGATRALLAQVPLVRDARMLNNIAFALERLDPAAFFATAKDLVSHKQAQIRMNAAFVVGDVKRPEGLPLLDTALGDKNDRVRVSATRAIGTLQLPDGLPLLKKALGDATDDVRGAAVEAIGAIKSPAGVPLLDAALSDKDSNIRYLAMESLGAIGSKDGLPIVDRYLNDADESVRHQAIVTSFELSGHTRTDLIWTKLYSDMNLRGQAIDLLAKANDPRVANDLVSCLEVGTCRVDEAQGSILAAKSKEAPGRLLLAWAKGRSDLTDFVASLHPASGADVARSEFLSSVAQQDLRRTLVSIDLMARLTNDQAPALLSGLLSHENGRVRLAASLALVRLGDEAGVKQLFVELDNLPREQLPSFVRQLGMISDPALRARLVPNLEAREKGAEVAVAIASAAVRTRWNPESGIFRLLAGLGGNTRAERDLSERYLIHDERPIITELLRRALARERRRDVLGELRRIVDVRADIQAKRPIEK